MMDPSHTATGMLRASGRVSKEADKVYRQDFRIVVFSFSLYAHTRLIYAAMLWCW